MNYISFAFPQGSVVSIRGPGWCVWRVAWCCNGRWYVRCREWRHVPRTAQSHTRRRRWGSGWYSELWWEYNYLLGVFIVIWLLYEYQLVWAAVIIYENINELVNVFSNINVTTSPSRSRHCIIGEDVCRGASLAAGDAGGPRPGGQEPRSFRQCRGDAEVQGAAAGPEEIIHIRRRKLSCK